MTRTTIFIAQHAHPNTHFITNQRGWSSCGWFEPYAQDKYPITEIQGSAKRSKLTPILQDNDYKIKLYVWNHNSGMFEILTWEQFVDGCSYFQYWKIPLDHKFTKLDLTKTYQEPLQALIPNNAWNDLLDRKEYQQLNPINQPISIWSDNDIPTIRWLELWHQQSEINMNYIKPYIEQLHQLLLNINLDTTDRNYSIIISPYHFNEIFHLITELTNIQLGRSNAIHTLITETVIIFDREETEIIKKSTSWIESWSKWINYWNTWIEQKHGHWNILMQVLIELLEYNGMDNSEILLAAPIDYPIIVYCKNNYWEEYKPWLYKLEKLWDPLFQNELCFWSTTKLREISQHLGLNIDWDLKYKSYTIVVVNDLIHDDVENNRICKLAIPRMLFNSCHETELKRYLQTILTKSERQKMIRNLRIINQTPIEAHLCDILIRITE